MTANRAIGVCTWTFGDRALPDIAGRLAGLNFDGVELMGDLNAYSPEEAAQILQAHQLQLFSLTPDNVDLAHPDAKIRGEALIYYQRLLDFAAQLGQPLVSCHGYVGRVRPVSSMEEEYALFVESVREVAAYAQTLGLKLVIEVLNRYESHLINTGASAAAFIADVGADNVGILLDAYHMNIEESKPAEALRQAGDQLWLYHAADSNRQGLGNGHIDFPAQLAALGDIGYQGPIILECTAPGPDPFAAIKDEESVDWLETYLKQSRQWLQQS